MLFPFLKKQKSNSHKKKLIETIIVSLNVSEDQKKLYIDSLDVLAEEELEMLYKKLTAFVEKIELKELGSIRDDNFASIAGMRKKEAKEKIQEVNSFSFLLNNL